MLSSANNSLVLGSGNRVDSGPRRQGTYWFGTLPANSGWGPSLPQGIAYLRGQLERGDGGFEHYQLFFICNRKASLSAIRAIWSTEGITNGHWELSRSSAAESYVWKEETRIGEPFEFGERPFRRNEPTDWLKVRVAATTGDFESIPDDIFVRLYHSICKIRADHLKPVAIVRTTHVFWGRTGTGKSRRAWAEAGEDAYGKDPRTKFWCGYAGSKNVIIDEFRGSIDISHLLRWLDRYPVRVELKGGSYPLMAESIWITSNIHPREWYPELDAATYAALERRLLIEEFE